MKESIKEKITMTLTLMGVLFFVVLLFLGAARASREQEEEREAAKKPTITREGPYIKTCYHYDGRTQNTEVLDTRTGVTYLVIQDRTSMTTTILGTNKEAIRYWLLMT